MDIYFVSLVDSFTERLTSTGYLQLIRQKLVLAYHHPNIKSTVTRMI